MYRLVEERAKPGGIPVGREPHDFVLVRVEVEPQVQCNQRIQNPDGIICRDLLELVEPAVVSTKNRCALHFAHRIDHNNEAVVPAGRVISACRMRQMMVYMMNALQWKSGYVPVHQPKQRFSGENFAR